MRGFRNWKQRLLRAGATALAVPVAAGMVGVGVAAAAPGPVHMTPQGGYQELMVPSTMGPIKVQVQWARRGGGAALYLLDGMMARNDWNAWSHTSADGQGGNARPEFANDNVTLVMPVGGESSFYTDWYSPSNFNGQQVTYKWETFLTQELPAYLARYGVSPSDDGIVGLSMGGSAALAMAAYHHNQFKFAATFSGAINLSAPGARTFFRLALLDKGGYNIDAMWGPPWSPAWTRNDPFTFAPKLSGISLFIASGDGIPQAGDFQMAPIDLVDGMVLEMLANVAAKSMQIRLESLGIPATYDFSWAGIHSWPYWSAELWRARPQILSALNAN
jgi:diacylglycerol O-acyltransferase / trehalose O-mycolyltransferase